MYRFLPLNLLLIPINAHNRTNFCSRNKYLWKVPVSRIIQNHWKKQLFNYELFSFSLTVEYIQLYNFRFKNFLWTHNACSLVVWKKFLFQMLRETSIFTLPGKVPLWQNVKMMFWVAIWIGMSPLTHRNLNSSSKTLGYKMTAWIQVGLL